MARRVFYSFHYDPDNWRASTVRQIGAIEGNKPATGNEWEEIKKDDAKITKWIKDQMYGKSVVLVLIGSGTAARKWINYEITHGWSEGKGVLGIYIHGLKGSDGKTAVKGANPFDYLAVGNGTKMSSLVRAYDPSGSNSQDIYETIKNNLADWFDEAVRIRNAAG